MSVIDKTNEYFIYSTYRSIKKTTEISLYRSDTHAHAHTYMYKCSYSWETDRQNWAWHCEKRKTNEPTTTIIRKR